MTTSLHDGISVAATGSGVMYRWKVLPPHPGLIAFFGILAAIFLGLGPALFAFGVALHQDGDGDGFGVAAFGALWSLASIPIGRWFAVVLLGRCRLHLGREGLDYEVFVLGRKIKSESRRVPAAHLVGLRIKDAAQGGIEVAREGGRPFYLKLPVGAGALSMPQLMGLRDRWLADLGRQTSAA
jgi:hypothetical protein